MVEFIDKAEVPTPHYDTSNVERNRLAAEDKAFHDWYRFVLSYPAHLVRKYIDEFKLSSEDVLLDPFCGTGTTVVEAKLQGVPSVGLEANRFAHFAGNVKINWDVNPDVLLDTATNIRDRVVARLRNQGVPDSSADDKVIRTTLLGFSDEQTKLILKNSMSPVPLHKSLVLLREIEKHKGTSVFKHLQLALAKALVFKVSNLKFGPEVGVGKQKTDVAVVQEWFAEVETMCADLGSLDAKEYPFASVKLSDSRGISENLHGTKISAVITSPPYPNEKDYTRTTRLESVMLGFVRDKQDLREMKKTLLRSNTRGVYSTDNDDQFVAHIPEIQDLANEIEERRLELGKTSGFERMYPRLTRLYFGGMAKHLKELQKVLKPGAMLAYVVGDQASYLRVMIRTGKLLEKIAIDLGYEKVRIDTFRTRFSTATKDWLNEEVVVLRWPGAK